MDRANTWVIQSRGGASFALKPLKCCWVGGEGARKEFDRDRAVQARVADLIHLTHSAGSQEFQHHVRTDLFVGRNHWFRRLPGPRGLVRFQKARCQFVIRKQRLYFTAKRVVVTGAFEVRVPLLGSPLARGMIQAFDLVPSIGQHMPYSLAALLICAYWLALYTFPLQTAIGEEYSR